MKVNSPFYKITKQKRKVKRRKSLGNLKTSDIKLTYKTRANVSFGSDTYQKKTKKELAYQKYMRRFNKVKPHLKSQPKPKKIKTERIKVVKENRPSPFDEIRVKKPTYIPKQETKKVKVPKQTTPKKTTTIKVKTKKSTIKYTKTKRDFSKKNVLDDLKKWRSQGHLKQRQYERYLKKLNNPERTISNRKLWTNIKRTAQKGHKIIKWIMEDFISKGGAFDADGRPVATTEGLMRYGMMILEHYYNNNVDEMMEDYYAATSQVKL